MVICIWLEKQQAESDSEQIGATTRPLSAAILGDGVRRYGFRFRPEVCRLRGSGRTLGSPKKVTLRPFKPTLPVGMNVGSRRIAAALFQQNS
jgi:hypothetical protein